MKRGIVAYDIMNSNYRSLLSKILKSYGERVQFSVFEFYLSNTEYEEFLIEIKDFYKDYEKYLITKGIKDKCKSIRVYIFCETCNNKKIIIGEKKELFKGEILII